MNYRPGQRVIIKADRKTQTGKQHGLILDIIDDRIVFVVVESRMDDGLREVRPSQLIPNYNHAGDQFHRARHAGRMFKQGVRVFRLGSPDGPTFWVDMIDGNDAVGHHEKRKTMKLVRLYDLFPSQY